MKAGRKNRISQCMIVKNEERNIERALSWGKAVMWEQIVVDTGSTDGTVKLAKKMGAKVFFLEWPEDFAAAKNYAIDRAKGEWIVFLDADEYMSEQDARKLPDVFRYLSDKDFDGITALLHNLDDTGKVFSSCCHLRFFRNIPDIRYKRRIHEQLISQSGRELQIMDGVGELSIFHTGYQEGISAEKRKSNRNRKLLQREIKEHPEDSEMLGYMGDEYFGGDKKEEAERWYRNAVEYMPSKLQEYDQRSAVTFTKLLMLLTEKENADWEEIREVYVQAVQAFPKEGDLDYIAGRFFVLQGKEKEAIEYLESALFKLEQYGCVNKALFLAGNVGEVYDLLAKCCYETGDSQKCVAYAVKHLKYDPYEMKPLFWLLKAFFQGKESMEDQRNIETVIGFLSKIYDFSLLKNQLFLLKTAEKAGCDGVVRFITECLLSLDERKKLGL